MPETPLPSLEELITGIEADLSPVEDLPRAANVSGNTEPAGKEQYIGFTMDGIRLAVPLNKTLEVGRLPEITPLPNLPSWILGIGNIRGEIVSMVDLKAFLGRGPSAGSAVGNGNMLLLTHGRMTVGFAVERLTGMAVFSRAQMSAVANPFHQEALLPYLSGVVAAGHGLLHILDVEKLLTSEKMNGF